MLARALSLLTILAVLVGVTLASMYYWRVSHEPKEEIPTATATDSTINWLTVTAQGDHPYSFDYPEDWRVKETSSVTRITYSSDVYIDIAYVRPAAYIDDIQNGEGSFTEFTNPDAKKADAEVRKLYIVSSGTATVGGQQTRTLEYCLLPQEGGLMTETCVLSTDIIFGEDTYNLTLNMRNANLATQKLQRPAYRAIHQKVLESLKKLSQDGSEQTL